MKRMLVLLAGTVLFAGLAFAHGESLRPPALILFDFAGYLARVARAP